MADPLLPPAPALTPAEWANRRTDNGNIYTTGGGELAAWDIALGTFAIIQDPHKAAALCLYGQDFGFTQEDVGALSRCADNAERFAATKMWDDRDHKAHERARVILAKIKALLPPAPPQP